MNLTVHEASVYLHKLDKKIANHRNVEVVLAPTMLCLQPLSLQVDHNKFKLAAQNLYWRDEGAFTGEVAAHQLRGLVKYAIIGHSERRHVFHEHEKDIRAKVQAAVRNHIVPILCVGETTHEKMNGETAHVIHDQVVSGLANLTAEEVADLVIAYEPVWAIGTGKIPTPEDIEKAIKDIRKQISHLYGASIASDVTILYGGSTNASNAASILQISGVDGLLPGGASLKLDEFAEMITIAHRRDR